MTDHDSAGCLTADALDLAVALDSFTTLDWAEGVGPAIQEGKETLAGLQQRRASLIATQSDGAVLDWMLEAIDARLKFVERLDAALGGTRTRGRARPEPRSVGPTDISSQRERPPKTVWESCSRVLAFYAGDDRAA